MRSFFPSSRKENSDNSIWLIGENPDLFHKDENVYIAGKLTCFCNANISIGEYTMIAHDVLIHTATHDYNDHPMWSKRIDRPVKIGKHVWIGTRAVILPGVVIEDYSVVGAGCVVAKNVPKGAIVVGNPARIIKFRDLDNLNRTIVDSPAMSETIKDSFLGKSYFI